MCSKVQSEFPSSGSFGEFQIRPQEPKYLRLKNYVEGSEVVDTLHQKTKIPLHCTNGRCTGSIMIPRGGETPQPRSYGTPRDKEEVTIHAEDFLKQYFASIARSNSDEYHERLAEVMMYIEENGSYSLLEKELLFAAKTAWRNASRCIGRIQWNNLKVFDARDARTAKEMFDALMRHLEFSLNKGNLRSAATIFPQRSEANKDFRIWNSQLLGFAGYRQPNGAVIGDPANVEFTEMCQSLGWKGNGGRFDILPLVLQALGGSPEFFDIPNDHVFRVKLKHPKYPWFEKLGLEWYAIPAVSNMMLDAGGLEFTGTAFSGWYMVTEIGARDLADEQRYNMLEVVAKKMGLDTTSNASLWKDFALVELNYAVMSSFTEAGITLADHHTTSEAFIQHIKKEVKLRGGCPADWVWIVPPMSGSATGVFHQEMLNYVLKPSYEYQPNPWTVYSVHGETKKKMSFKSVARNVLSKRTKATILFATETGRSERFAWNLAKVLSHIFDVLCMDEYEYRRLVHEKLLFVVTSTFVFGLGSRAYPDFCAFGHYVDDHLRELGAQTILTMGEGDDLAGQEESFKEWTKDVFKMAANCFGVNTEAASKVVSDSLKEMVSGWSPGLYRWVSDNTIPMDLCTNLSKAYNKTVCSAKVISVTELQTKRSRRSTVLVKLNTGNATQQLAFEPGDHVAIFPANKASLVQELIDLMHVKPDPNQPIRIEVAHEDSGKQNGTMTWKPFNRLPAGCTLTEALTRYLDITAVPTPQMLKYLAKLATSTLEKMQLEALGKGYSCYEEWALLKECNILETLREFPSVKATADLLLTQLPALQPRFYSISSSPDVYPKEIHVTAMVFEYKKRAQAFHLPSDGSAPLILVGTGTGIAPLRSFWQQRVSDMNKKSPPKSAITGRRQWGDIRLFFGCRNPFLDDIYRNEIEEAVRSKVLRSVATAYSREKGKPKQYVQDLLRKDSADLCDLILNRHAHVYVCGAADMAKGVYQTIQSSSQYHEDIFEVPRKIKEPKEREDMKVMNGVLLLSQTSSVNLLRNL
ncbi:Nitric oxide synthase [Acropora cervicornis]|uniref:nitric-oxide synthase (NADPH) n=1 Tax=Acropora cervicornis TaxID=6130 RepID=A0AAD9R6U1_ACRCE|nr:Nitric oxide synthase [Acropora cervicornis]